jgi:hypothetical protein
VDSRSDALINKARIAIQIQPSGRQSTWSECTFNSYGNLVFNFNRPDDHLSWSGRAKALLEITWSGRATVRTTVPHCSDAALKQERFSLKISEILSHSCPSRRLRFTVRMESVHITIVAYLNPQPINRGPWALRTARIRY